MNNTAAPTNPTNAFEGASCDCGRGVLTLDRERTTHSRRAWKGCGATYICTICGLLSWGRNLW